ncbi:MAG TPA: TraM recognition domain-containing protein [Pirellulales bacterium]
MTDDQLIGFCLFGLCLLALAIHQKRRRGRLDHRLFHWTKQDPFTVRDLLNGGVCVIGRVGSGKTSSSGTMLAQAIVNYRNSGGLICAAKPGEDLKLWRKIFARAGRSKDLLVFEPNGKLRFNFLAEAMRQGGSTREITKCITTIGETLRSSGRQGRSGDGEFWEREQERMIYNAVQVVKLARGTVTAPELQEFITTAAANATQLSDEAWRSGFHCRAMEAAFHAQKSNFDAHDLQLAQDYWLGEIPTMADRTKSSILVGVLGVLHTFNTGMVRELVSTTTNVSPEQMLRRKWILVNMPPAVYGDAGSFINAGWKYLAQKEILRREARHSDPINVIWCDEAAQFCNSMDQHYVSQCRSHLGCLIYLCQSLHSFHATLKGEDGKQQAQALLANFGHRVFHALGDIETAEWASGLIGARLETFMGGSMQPSQGIYDDLMGNSQYSGTFSSQYAPILQTTEFLSGLRTGGRKAGYMCDGIVIRSGEPFSNGENWLRMAFMQR